MTDEPDSQADYEKFKDEIVDEVTDEVVDEVGDRFATTDEIPDQDEIGQEVERTTKEMFDHLANEDCDTPSCQQIRQSMGIDFDDHDHDDDPEESGDDPEETEAESGDDDPDDDPDDDDPFAVSDPGNDLTEDNRAFAGE